MLERLNILASTTYSDEHGDAAVDMQCNAEKKSQDAHFIHWLHIQRPEMDLEEFERLALQSPRISDEMTLVVNHLMTMVREKLEKSFVHGRYMLPGALRCDGRDASKNDKEDISAVWMCVPYFSLEAMHQHSRGEFSPSNLHPLRTLLQSCYDFESTRERDVEQHNYLKAGREEVSAVHIPQVWCLILGSGKTPDHAGSWYGTLMAQNQTQLSLHRMLTWAQYLALESAELILLEVLTSLAS